MSQQTLPIKMPCNHSPELIKVSIFFSNMCLVLSKRCPQRKKECFGDIPLKKPNNVLFQHIHSYTILIMMFDVIQKIAVRRKNAKLIHESN